MGLNTTPATFAAGEVVTASKLNTEVRDAITGIQTAWTAYTPTLTSLTLGNGTMVARYMRIGKTIHIRISLAGGSTSSAAGAWSVSVPVQVHASGNQILMTRRWTGAALTFGSAWLAANATTFVVSEAGFPSGVTAFGNGHEVLIQGTYECA